MELLYGGCKETQNKMAKVVFYRAQFVTDCLMQGKEHGFRVLQFHAVVATNV